MEVLSKECELKKLRKNELENKYDDISKKLTRAEELMESLQDEQVWWVSISEIHKVASVVLID